MRMEVDSGMLVRWVNREKGMWYSAWKVTDRNSKSLQWDVRNWKRERVVKSDGLRRWKCVMERKSTSE